MVQNGGGRRCVSRGEQEGLGGTTTKRFARNDIPPWEDLAGPFPEEKRIDLLVFSTHAGSGLQKLLFGSVADDIFRSSPCPVLAVGPGVRIKPRANAELNRILYATDFKAESLAVAPYAISLAQEHRAQLVLLHSIEKKGDVPAMLHSLHQLVKLGAELRTEPVCIVVHGSPAGKILEVAEAHGADLIMLGIQSNNKTLENICFAQAYSKSSRAQGVPYLSFADRGQIRKILNRWLRESIPARRHSSPFRLTRHIQADWNLTLIQSS